ncbi:hypothetical protein AJ79_07098 [Helicocarpus griseus UAMH5409]|uniref:AT hook domain-containing protein family protein n=1 Tax=Helicocarpus griseus UAMH5409 TaxID=1447875 RepID=A0A2B7X6Q4_9EURO|nr:hypothetical protein AJ79_07098 [Helicocarpus griseus UAMH5409]
MSTGTKRTLRSSTKQHGQSKSPISPTPTSPPTIPSSITITNSPIPIPPQHCSDSVKFVPQNCKLPGLSNTSLSLLRKKQGRLSLSASNTLSLLPNAHLSNALAASLIFAQHEAGSAVCIDPAGWVITCAHCFGETEDGYNGSSKTRWLLFYDGQAVQVQCRAWDGKKDLALLKIIAVESDVASVATDANGVMMSASFAFVPLCSRESPAVDTPIICIGQPGSEDLESIYPRKTDYNLVEVSEGLFRGMVAGANPCDNSEIGTLKHDAWTYWGHSGAPLLREVDGALIGVHSSWDDETAMRHGVPLIAIKEFLREHRELMRGKSVEQNESTDLTRRDRAAQKGETARSRAVRPKNGNQGPDAKDGDVIVISDSSDAGH